MGVITLQVAHDHLEGLANPQKALLGIEELIWNGLDADASKIDVIFDENELGDTYQIRVLDNGSGIPHPQCENAFGSLGGSSKRFTQRTPNGRRTHGKLGKGRFRAFCVGRRIEWISVYRSLHLVNKYSIHATRDKLSEFQFSDPRSVQATETGVEVIISELFYGKASELRDSKSRMELGQRLALYLAAYQNIVVNFDGQSINLDELKLRSDILRFDTVLPNGTIDQATLTVVEWKNNAGRTLYFCNADNIAIHEADSGVKDRSFNFSAYLTSPAVAEIAESGALLLSELDPTNKAILKTTRDALSKHFRRRESERSVDLVKQWRKSKIYPYKNNDAGPLEQAEREVFDICALKVHEYLPGFQKLDPKSQRLTFQLIREALKSPSSLKRILEAALGMPKEQQEELATLLEKTSLTAIINASKLVMDRLAFLESINEILYGTFKEEILERTQFQRILVEELWVFGEQYLLGVDDQGLKTLLEKHVRILGRETICGPEAKVFDLHGRRRVLDLMLYRRIPQTIPDCHEHLVVELKAPTCTIGEKEISQIKNYAYTVFEDERFDKINTRWTFILIGNKFGRFAENESTVDGRERGHLISKEGGKFNVHVKEWSNILGTIKWRYEFFRSKLEYQASTSDGIEYLKRKHSEYLPDLSSGDDNQESQRNGSVSSAI